ncbi:hypothetical protein JCM4914_36860 [Streptomyces platensis subsp. malvinus]
MYRRARVGTVDGMQQLSRPARRALLVLHVAVSVSWLGLTLGLLALSITGWTSSSPEMAAAAYRAMKVFGDWLILPLAFGALFTGLVLSLGTPWGLARHRWVYVKFWLTLVTVLLSVFALRPGIDRLAAEAATGTPVPDIGLVIAPAVASATCFFLTAISVLKPWGPTGRGRRLREELREELREDRAAGPAPTECRGTAGRARASADGRPVGPRSLTAVAAWNTRPSAANRRQGCPVVRGALSLGTICSQRRSVVTAVGRPAPARSSSLQARLRYHAEDDPMVLVGCATTEADRADQPAVAVERHPAREEEQRPVQRRGQRVEEPVGPYQCGGGSYRWSCG